MHFGAICLFAFLRRHSHIFLLNMNMSLCYTTANEENCESPQSHKVCRFRMVRFWIPFMMETTSKKIKCSYNKIQYWEITYNWVKPVEGHSQMFFWRICIVLSGGVEEYNAKWRPEATTTWSADAKRRQCETQMWDDYNVKLWRCEATTMWSDNDVKHRCKRLRCETTTMWHGTCESLPEDKAKRCYELWGRIKKNIFKVRQTLQYINFRLTLRLGNVSHIVPLKHTLYPTFGLLGCGQSP